MGLLDDAIREHLELKRVHGAGDEELNRLEQEVFSPPSRPGDPDFGPGPEQASDGQETGAEPLDAGAADDRSGEDPEADLSGTELGRVEHSTLDDTVPHPVTDETSVAAPADPPEAPESAIFLGEDDLEIDLDLDIEDEGEVEIPAPPPSPSTDAGEDDFLSKADFGAAFDTPSSAPGEGSVAPARIDDPLETGEQPAPLIPDERLEEEEGLLEEVSEAEQGASDDDEGDGEDILEETPDFLKEAPEGENLWFEQGKPKDFDFGEDD